MNAPSRSQNKLNYNKMKTIKTYGVYGMVEKTIILNHKGSELKVTFTGGSANTNGIIPAKYTTDNPVFQYIIEHSKLYELKNIKLVRSVNVKEEGDAEVSGKALKEALAKAEKKAEEKADGAQETVVAADGVKEVEVTDLQSDARQYLIKECGLKAHDVRSKDQIEKAAAGLGIRFVVK